MAHPFRNIIRRLLVVLAIPGLLALGPGAAVQAAELGQECTNPEIGYTVGFPTGWYVNDRIEGGELEDVAACRFFSPEDFEVQPQAGIADVAIAIGLESSGPPGELTPEATVGGKPAFITETQTGDGGIEPPGTRHYAYWIELGPDSWLLADTSDAPNFVGDHDENRAVLDGMMASLTFRAPPMLPDTAMSSAGAHAGRGAPSPDSAHRRATRHPTVMCGRYAAVDLH